MNRRFLTLEQLKSVTSTLLAKINQKPDSSSLSEVSFTGDYNDLSNRPDFSNFVNKTDFQNSYSAAMQQIGENCMVIGRDYVTAGQMPGTILGTKATAEGNYTTATANYSHAEGDNTTASGDSSHAEGDYTSANGTSSHAEGSNTAANGYYSHAEGSNTTANGDYSHAEGTHTFAQGSESHAEGHGLTFIISLDPPNGTTYSITTGKPSDVYQNCPARIEGEAAEITSFGVSEGKISSITFNQTLERNQSYYSLQFYNTRDAQSHSEGIGTIAYDAAQHAGGKYNIPINGAEVIGGGTSSVPANIRTLDWSGNEVLAGKLTVGADPTADMDVATKQYVDAEVDGVLPSQSEQGGKFLTTNGTTASWADAKELFLVTFTVNSNNIYSADHTMSEIAAAASAGKIVKGVLNDGSNGNLYFNNVKSYLFATTNYNHSGQGNASFIMLYGEYDGTSEFWMRHEKEPTLTTYTNIFVPSMTVVTIPYDDLEDAYYSGSVVKALAPKPDGSYEYYVAESCSNRADASATGTMIFSNSNGKLILTYDPNGGTYEADKQSWQFISSVGAFIAIVNTTTYNELVNALATNVPIFAYAVGSSTKDLFQLVYYSGSAFIFTQPYYNSASSNGPALFSYSIDSTNKWTAMNTYLAPGTHNHAASNITSGTLSVARGGTGAATLTSGAVLIGNGTSAIATRSITNNTSSTALAANTNIPTMNTVKYGLDNRLNRTTAVNAADTGYTTYMARGEALNSADTNPTVNGAISWTYA